MHYMLKKMSKGWVKMVLGWTFCFAWRVFPFRPPNVEPILATTMPFGKRYGPFGSFLFAALNVILYDLLTGTAGSWTVTGALAYGLVGFGAGLFLRRDAALWMYPAYAIIGTLVFDGLTGVLFAHLFSTMSYREAFLGQIPFTVNHLIGNVILSLCLSPLLEKFVMKNDALDADALFGRSCRSRAP